MFRSSCALQLMENGLAGVLMVLVQLHAVVVSRKDPELALIQDQLELVKRVLVLIPSSRIVIKHLAQVNYLHYILCSFVIFKR